MEWIACNDRLPEEGTVCIVKNAKGWTLAFLIDGEWEFQFLALVDPVTHWLVPKI